MNTAEVAFYVVYSFMIFGFMLVNCYMLLDDLEGKDQSKLLIRLAFRGFSFRIIWAVLWPLAIAAYVYDWWVHLPED
jgi:hypothetical protein